MKHKIKKSHLQGILRAADSLITDPKTNRTVQELARIALVNEFDFKRLFRVIFAESKHSFLVAQRLAKAKMLLAETNLKIYEIAAECGYNAEHFTKLFKHKTGHSPAAYRRNFTIVCESDQMK